MIYPSKLDSNELFLYHLVQEKSSRAIDMNSHEFINFLNPREQEIAKTACISSYELFGGYQNATRKMMQFTNTNNEILSFPISVVKIKHNKKDTLAHNHVLGSLMGLGIKRNCIGDILPTLGECFVICTSNISSFLLNELKQIGSLGISCELSNLNNFKFTQEYKEFIGTVSSPRLDNIVALITKQSRSVATSLITSGQVLQNYVMVEKNSTLFHVKDIITIRKYGKYVIDVIGNPTRKGRLPIQYRRYE